MYIYIYVCIYDPGSPGPSPPKGSPLFRVAEVVVAVSSPTPCGVAVVVVAGSSLRFHPPLSGVAVMVVMVSSIPCGVAVVLVMVSSIPCAVAVVDSGFIQPLVVWLWCW